MALVTVTLGEILDSNDSSAWDNFCDDHGINRWCVLEGADEESEYSITLEQAKKYGLMEDK